MLDSEIQSIKSNAITISKQLQNVSISAFKLYPDLKNEIYKLKDILHQYEINNRKRKKNNGKFKDEIDNLDEYIVIVQFGKDYHQQLDNIIIQLKDLLNINNEIKEKINNSFSNIFQDVLMFSKEYTEFIEKVSKEASNIMHNINNKNNIINEIADNMNTIGTAINVTSSYDYQSAIEAIKALGSNPDPEAIENIINNIDTISGRIAVRLWKGFDLIGDYANKGIDYVGEILSGLVMKIAKGFENIEYCIDIIGKEGFNGFLNDSRCITTLSYTILYGIATYFALKILRAILRKISSFTGWLGGSRGYY